MRYNQLFAVSITIALFSAHCARPCPKDIELGTLTLDSNSRSFLPVSQEVQTMQFTNAAGAALSFSSTNKGVSDTEVPVETLCQRGDYLDKTAQVSKYITSTKRWSYATAANDYTLDIQLDIENLGAYGSPNDTVFIEKFVTWGQKIATPARVGTMSILTSERGNTAKISDTQRQNYTKFQFVADTVLNGRTITNAYITPKDGNQSLFIFYTKANGIEAFTTDTEVWLRQP